MNTTLPLDSAASANPGKTPRSFRTLTVSRKSKQLTLSLIWPLSAARKLPSNSTEAEQATRVRERGVPPLSRSLSLSIELSLPVFWSCSSAADAGHARKCTSLRHIRAGGRVRFHYSPSLSASAQTRKLCTNPPLAEACPAVLNVSLSPSLGLSLCCRRGSKCCLIL